MLYLLVAEDDDADEVEVEITVDANMGNLQVFKVDVDVEHNFDLDNEALLTDSNDESFEYVEELLTSGVISFKLIWRRLINRLASLRMRSINSAFV